MPQAIIPAALALGGGLGGAALGGSALFGSTALGSILGGALGSAAGDVVGDAATGQPVNPLGVGLSAVGGGIGGALNAPASAAAAPATSAGTGAALTAGGGASAAVDPLSGTLGDSAVSDFAVPQASSATPFFATGDAGQVAGAPLGQITPQLATGLPDTSLSSFPAGTDQLISGASLGSSISTPSGATPSNTPSETNVPIGGSSDLGPLNFGTPTGFNAGNINVPIGGTSATPIGVPSMGSTPMGIGGGGPLGSAAGISSAAPGGGDINDLLAQVQANYGGAGNAGSGFLSNVGDKIGNFLSKNATSLGLGAAGVVGAPLLKSVAPNLFAPPMPFQNQISGLANEANSIAGQLTSSETTGILPPGQQSMVQQALQDAQTNIRAKYASMGLAGSTMEQQDLAAAQDRATATTAQLAAQATQTGLSAMGTADQLYSQIADYQLQEDQGLQSSISNLAGALGTGAGLTSVAQAIAGNQ